MFKGIKYFRLEINMKWKCNEMNLKYIEIKLSKV